jgi:hypothetical protein
LEKRPASNLAPLAPLDEDSQRFKKAVKEALAELTAELPREAACYRAHRQRTLPQEAARLEIILQTARNYASRFPKKLAERVRARLQKTSGTFAARQDGGAGS